MRRTTIRSLKSVRAVMSVSLACSLLAACGQEAAPAVPPAAAPAAQGPAEQALVEQAAPTLPQSGPGSGSGGEAAAAGGLPSRAADAPAAGAAGAASGRADVEALDWDGLAAALPELLGAAGRPPMEALADWGAIPDPRDGAARWREADLDGNGSPEWVAVLKAPNPEAPRHGALTVISTAAGRHKADYLPIPEDYFLGASVDEIADIDNDGSMELVWSWITSSAHSPSTHFAVARWEPGRLVNVPGPDPATPNLSEYRREGADLLLRGGIISSAGAGTWQRERTDRYRIDGGGLRLIDRSYDPAGNGYDELIDGIAAETYGRREQALEAYRRAQTAARYASGEPPVFERPTIGVVEGDQAQAYLPVFADAVKAFAAFREALLRLQLGQAAVPGGPAADPAADRPFAELASLAAGAETAEAACKAADEWADRHPKFLEAINAPFGYANPRWKADTLCGGLPLD